MCRRLNERAARRGPITLAVAGLVGPAILEENRVIRKHDAVKQQPHVNNALLRLQTVLTAS